MRTYRLQSDESPNVGDVLIVRQIRGNLVVCDEVIPGQKQVRRGPKFEAKPPKGEQ